MMRYLTLKCAFLVTVPSPLLGEVPQADAAKEALSKAQTCHIGGLGPLRRLIKEYGSISDPDIEVVVAQARYQMAFVYWFRQSEDEAQHLLKSAVKRYESKTDDRLQAVAAQARLLLGAAEKNPRRKRAYLKPILDKYKYSQSVTLTYSYAKALHSLSNIEREAGNTAEADRLSQEGSRIIQEKVVRNLVVSDPKNEIICV